MCAVLCGRTAQRIDVDVTVTHAPCYPDRPVKAQLQDRAKFKTEKYKKPSEQLGNTFIPLAMSSMGTFAPQVNEFLELLAQHAFENFLTRDTKTFIREAQLALLSSLHRGNYLVQKYLTDMVGLGAAYRARVAQIDGMVGVG